VFFSLSPGKRGQYILPALPAVIIAAAPYIHEIIAKLWLRRVVLAVVSILSAGLIFVPVIAKWVTPVVAQNFVAKNGFDPFYVLLAAGLSGIAVMMFYARNMLKESIKIAVLLWCSIWMLFAFWAYPVANHARSWADLEQLVMRNVPQGTELAVVHWKEQMLLGWTTPVTQFGFLVPVVEQEKQAIDWLLEADKRVVLLTLDKVSPGYCFDLSKGQNLGLLHRREWVLLGPEAIKNSCDDVK